MTSHDLEGREKGDKVAKGSKLEMLWRLPLGGDGRTVRAEQWARGDYAPQRTAAQPFARTGVSRDGYTYYDHLLQIARAAELNGFDGLWIPESPGGEEPLIVAGSLAREVTRLKLVLSLRAALVSAVYATKIAVSFQRLTAGRLAWNLVTTEDGNPHPWHGRRWSESEHAARSAEFLKVAKGFWNQAPFTYKGRYYEVVDGGFSPALQGQRLPQVYLSGVGPETCEVSARHADVQILPLAPLAEVREQIAALNTLATSHGNTLRYGIEADVLARHSSEEAWAELRRQWDAARAKTVSISSADPVAPGSSFEELKRGNNLWLGFDLLRPGPRAGLVGSYDEVAKALALYEQAGVSTLVLGANPHLEEAYLLGEHLLPLVHREPPALAQKSG